MSRTDAGMPLYVGYYLADTTHLTLEQSGAYLHLLMSQWRVGYVPADPQKLAAICRVTRTHWVRHLAPAILPFFEDRGDRLVQRRLEAEANRARKGRKNEAKNRVDRAENQAEITAKTAENTSPQSNQNNEVAQPLARAPTRVPSQSQSEEEGSVGLRPTDAATAASPSPRRDAAARDTPPTIREALWRDGPPILRALIGLGDRQTRTLLGRLLRDARDDAAAVHALLHEAQSLHPADPQAWLMAAARNRGGGATGSRRGRLDVEWFDREMGAAGYFGSSRAPPDPYSGPMLDAIPAEETLL